MAEAAYNFVILARQLSSYYNFKNAFEMYLCSFNKHPETKSRYEKEFHEVLAKMNENLAAAGRMADIFAYFERAIKVFPDSVNILNDIGKYLYRYGYHSEALWHFEKALYIDNSFVGIEKSLNSTKRLLFPRGKFRVLNDKIRNDAYRKAIQHCVDSTTDSVINIDAGTGLLALYASACKPIATTACEFSNTMARLAECIVRDNNAEEVVIINKPSVIINQTDIYRSRSVLITDLIDSGLFGDNILQALCHAWENLLYNGSKVIPGRAEYFIVGVKSDKLVNKYQLRADTKHMLNVPNMTVHRATDSGESYYGEDVNLYEDLKYMSKPKSLFKINFNHYYDVFEKLHKQVPYTAVLTAAEDGEVNAIIGYFNLHLNEDITVCSDPRCEGRANAWQQAVFFDFLPRKVNKNETICIPFKTFGGRIITVPPPDVPITRISLDALKFLNDSEYMKMIAESLGTVCIYLGQTVDLSYVDILDSAPFPMFGLLMMMRGANSLVCHATLPEDKAFLQTVLRANHIPEDKVTILVGTYWSDEVFKDKKFHVIFNHILGFTGDIDVKKKQILEHLVDAHLYEGGLPLPIKVTLIGQLVNSEWLEINNRITDENVDGYKMAVHVNRYQVSQALLLDFSRLKYTSISEEFVIASSCADMKSGVIKAQVATDGDCNAILCWYKIQLLEGGGCTATMRGDSCVPGMAFMNTTSERVYVGDEVDVLRCVDPDGSFKLVMDVEPY